MPVHVRRLAPEPASTNDIEEAAQWLIDAFANDPIMPPCLGGEMHLSANLFRGFIKAGLAGGEVYVAGVDSDKGVDGVAVWFAPGTEFLGTEAQQTAWHENFGKHLNEDARRFWEQNFEAACNIVLNAVLGESGHHSMWHLQLIGTRLSAQKQGVARALIEHIAEKAMTAGMRLETFTELNVKIYEHLGFVSEGGTATVSAPQNDVTIWAMFKWPSSRNAS